MSSVEMFVFLKMGVISENFFFSWSGTCISTSTTPKKLPWRTSSNPFFFRPLAPPLNHGRVTDGSQIVDVFHSTLIPVPVGFPTGRVRVFGVEARRAPVPITPHVLVGGVTGGVKTIHGQLSVPQSLLRVVQSGSQAYSTLVAGPGQPLIRFTEREYGLQFVSHLLLMGVQSHGHRLGQRPQIEGIGVVSDDFLAHLLRIVPDQRFISLRVSFKNNCWSPHHVVAKETVQLCGVKD